MHEVDDFPGPEDDDHDRWYVDWYESGEADEEPDWAALEPYRVDLIKYRTHPAFNEAPPF